MTPTTVLSNWASMILPVAGIAVVAALLPLMLATRLPQSWGGLGVNLVISGGVLMAVSAGYFAGFYLLEDARMLAMIGEVSGAAGWHFLRLGVLSAMVWGPIVLLVLAMQPQKWRPEL